MANKLRINPRTHQVELVDEFGNVVPQGQKSIEVGSNQFNPLQPVQGFPQQAPPQISVEEEVMRSPREEIGLYTPGLRARLRGDQNYSPPSTPLAQQQQPAPPMPPPPTESGRSVEDMMREDDARRWDQIQDKRRTLTGLRGIAEGLGNIQPAIGIYKHGMDYGGQPFVAENIREDEAELINRINPVEAEVLRNHGVEGARVGMRRDFVNSMSRSNRDQGIQDRFDRNLEYKQDALGASQRQKVASAYQTDRQVQSAQKTLANTRDVRNLLLNPNAQNDSSVFSKVPRLMGEVGNLSAFDQKINRNRLGFANQLVDAWNRGVLGRLSDDQRSQLLELVDIMEDAAQRTMDQRADTISGTYSQVYPNQSQESIRGMIRPQTGGRMIPIELDGDEGEIPEDQWEAFQAKYPHATRR